MLVTATLISGLAIGCIYSLVAIGFSLIFRATGLINFAQGEMVAVGALVGYTLITTLGLPFWPALVLTMAAGAVASLVIERFVFRPMRLRRMPEINLIIATVGLIIIVQDGGEAIWGAQALAYSQGLATGSIHVGSLTISIQNVAIFLLGMAMMLGLQLFFQKSRPGRAMRAAASDPTMASLLGVNVNLTNSITAVLAGALGALAGVLLAPIYYASYDLGLIGFKAFAAAILGGFGSVVGAMIGGLVVGELETVGSIYISSAYKDAIAYGLIIVLLLFWPTGLLGKRVWQNR